MADAFAALGADGARVLETSRARVQATEHKAFLVRMRILQSTIETLAVEQEHEKSLGRKAARRVQPRPPAPSVCAMFSSQHALCGSSAAKCSRCKGTATKAKRKDWLTSSCFELINVDGAFFDPPPLGGGCI
jgi:hypothetical protein